MTTVGSKPHDGKTPKAPKAEKTKTEGTKKAPKRPAHEMVAHYKTKLAALDARHEQARSKYVHLIKHNEAILAGNAPAEETAIAVLADGLTDAELTAKIKQLQAAKRLINTADEKTLAKLKAEAEKSQSQPE